MEVAAIILFGGVMVFAAHFFSWLFSFTRISDTLLLILTGIVVGPLLGQITPEYFGETGSLFSLIVLTIILFEGGTEMRWDIIRGAFKGAAALTFVGFFITMAAVGGLVWLLTDIPFLLSLALGAIIGETSAPAVLPLLEKLSIGQEAKTALSLEAAFSDVIAVVVGTALVAAFTAGSIAADSLAVGVAVSFLAAGGIGVLAGVVWSLLLAKVRTMENSIFTTPAFVFILFGLCEYFGFAGPIAALTFGITLGNSGYFKLWLERKHMILHALLHPLSLSERERSFFSEVVFVLQTFFFVYVGISIPLQGSSQAWWFAAVMVLAIFALRLLIVRFTSEQDVPAPDRAFMAGIAPKGLATAVLATLLFQPHLPGGAFLQQTSYLIIFISIVSTSLLIFLLSHTPLMKLYKTITGGEEGETPHAGIT